MQKDEQRLLVDAREYMNLWTYGDLASFLKVSEQKLRMDVMKRKIPFKKIGRLVRFDPIEIIQWLNSENSEMGCADERK